VTSVGASNGPGLSPLLGPRLGRVRLARWLALAARLSFAMLVLVMPFRARADPLPHPPSSVPAVLGDLVIYALDVLLVATLALWLAARALDRRPLEPGPRALRLPVLALLGLAWLTIPFGVESGLSVVGAIRLTLGALLALYVVNEVDGLDSIAVPLGLMLTIQAGAALGQATTGGPVGLQLLGELDLDPGVAGTSVVTTTDGTRVLRAYGLSPHPNILGGFLACGLVLLMGVLTVSRTARLVQAAVVVLAAAALLATFSRGAWLGGLAGLVVGLAILLWRVSGPRATRWLATGALALAVFVAAGWLARDAVGSRAGLAPAAIATEDRSIDERLEQIRLGWRVVLERPLTGAGASALPMAMRDLEPDFPYAFYAPHLVPLAVAGELGIAGGLAYLWLLAAPWALLAGRRGRWTAELAGASAGLAALTVVSLFDDYPWVGGPGRTLGWLVVGLWALAWTRAPGPGSWRPRIGQGPGVPRGAGDGR
jgi:hypothetical protein